VALLLTTQPLPPGDRVAVVSNSTAVAVLVADACASEHLPLQRLTDVGADGTPEVFETAVLDAVRAADVDAVVAVFVPPLMDIAADEYALALHAAAAMGASRCCRRSSASRASRPRWPSPGVRAHPGSVPSYRTPERAVRPWPVSCVTRSGGVVRR